MENIKGYNMMFVDVINAYVASVKEHDTDEINLGFDNFDYAVWDKDYHVIMIADTKGNILSIDAYNADAREKIYKSLYSSMLADMAEAEKVLSFKPRSIKVEWDYDEEDEKVSLPSSIIEVPNYLDDEEITDWLTDEYGWCVTDWVDTK